SSGQPSRAEASETDDGAGCTRMSMPSRISVDPIPKNIGSPLASTARRRSVRTTSARAGTNGLGSGTRSAPTEGSRRPSWGGRSRHCEPAYGPGVRYFAAALPVDEGRTIPRRSQHMTSPTTLPAATPVVISLPRAALQLAFVAFLALVAYYFIGVDEGMTSAF